MNGFKLDLEIYQSNFNNEEINWSEVEFFMEYLVTHQDFIKNGIKSAMNIFNSFIREVWERAFTKEDFDNIVFEPSVIEYKGKINTSYTHRNFLYNIFFNPVDLINTEKDFGTIVWCASFLDNQLIGVKRDL